MTVLALAERVEELTAPDRELDAEIDAVINGGRASHTFTDDDDASRLRRSYEPGSVFDHVDPRTNGGHVLSSMVRHSPRYTSSFEAIRSLGGLCLFASEIAADGLALVRIVVDTSTTPVVEYTGIASSLEYAWLSAALRSRAG